MLQLAQTRLIYISNLNNKVCDNALSFTEKNLNLFTEKTNWSCKVKTTHKSFQNILIHKDLLDLKLEILKHCDLYMRETDNFFDGFIDQSWINFYEKGFYQEFHRHDNKIYQHISGVVYLSNQNSNIDFFIDDTFTHEPKKNEIIIFDNNIEHQVRPNQNEKPRISLAFNFRKCVHYA